MKEQKILPGKIGRRQFIQQSFLAGTAFMMVPRHVLGGKGFIAPSDRLHIACVGIGGKGRVDAHGVRDEYVVALCDVDRKRASESTNNEGNAYQAFPDARIYKDFRVMLDEMNDIDAMTISTPDHTHAIITMAAMKKGIHVFTQKPLTRTIQESRLLTDYAAKSGIVTQMGNQGHANAGPRILNELIWQGAIGTVSRVHCWTDRPVWPQGMKSFPGGDHTPPETLDWDLWLGPAAYRPYAPEIVPFNWRGYWDFGCGALGDMGCHIMDYPFWALKLASPLSVEAYSTPVNSITAPHASMVHYDFISGLDNTRIELIWYDGGLKPRMPGGLVSETGLWTRGSGVIFEGSEGILVYGHHQPKPVLLRAGKETDYDPPAEMIPRSIGHYREWISQIKGTGHEAMSGFGYAGPLNEAVLLGNVAIRCKTKIEWDPIRMTITNFPEGNRFLSDTAREGWELI